MVSTSKQPGILQRIRRTLVGAPIPTAREQHERLSLFYGLPVFASDALSSSAYATEAIVSTLILISVAAMGLQPAITVAICVLYLIVVISYHQTVHAYPSGGGSYIVSAENLGEKPAVIAGSALLIDYVLTVAVSVAAGVAALISAFPGLHDLMIPLNVTFISLIAWANLRGVRESGMMFALPSYAFLAGMFALIGFGIFKTFGQPMPVQSVLAEAGMIGKEAALPMAFLLLRAFSAGCVALTGVEAISNGVPAFKAPESKNAAASLRWLAVLMILMFLGTGYLIQHLPSVSLFATANPEYRTVVSQIAAYVFGQATVGFFYIQIATAVILILAANTAFADFPRLGSILARDGYLPRPMARLGDRLVFQNGIIVLAAFAIALVWYFHGELDMLLPLYAVGVFTAFTLSQSGMVRHWIKERSRGWRGRLTINAIGAICTGVVAIVILVTKFREGAWLVLVLVTLISTGLVATKRRYARIAEQLTPVLQAGPKNVSQGAIILVPRVHRGILSAVRYAQSLHGEVRALHVSLDSRNIGKVKQDWEAFVPDVPLVVIESPFRSLIEPVLEYVDEMNALDPERVVTVIVPEAVATKWIHRFLQENVAGQIKSALGRRRNVVVTNVRYFLD